MLNAQWEGDNPISMDGVPDLRDHNSIKNQTL